MALRLLALAALAAAITSTALAQTGAFPRFNDGVATAPASATANAPFDVAKMFDAPSRDQNAAPLYLTALAEFGTETVACCYPRESPEYEPRFREAQARAGRFSAIFDRWIQDPKSVGAAELDGLVAEHAEGFRLLREAQVRERCVFQTGVGVTALLPHVQAARGVARVAAIKARRELDRGEIDEAIADVAVVLRLARDLQPRGYIITQLVTIAMTQALGKDVIAPILAAPGLTPAQCAILLSTLKVHESRSVDAFTECLRMEYASSRVTLDQLVHDQDRLRKQLDVAPGASIIQSLFTTFAMGPPAANNAPPQAKLPADVDALVRNSTRPQIDRAVDRLNAYYRPLLALKGRPRNEQVAALPDVRAAFPGNDPLTRLLLELQPAVEAFIPPLGRGEASLRATMALAAIRHWALTHKGAYPTPAEFASACRAAGLPAIPLDPFNGKPLQLTVTGGEPTVSSVGKDGRGNLLTYRLPKPKPDPR